MSRAALPQTRRQTTTRRLRAYAIDVSVMAGWQGVLAASSLLPGARWRTRVFRDPRTADLAQFTAGVLPAALYLGGGEASTAQATAGKRAAGLMVVTAGDGGRASARTIAVRTGVKLLPWQLAHLAVTRATGVVGGRHAERTARAAFGAALALSAVSLTLAVCRPDGRALHDLVAGTRVVPGKAGGGDTDPDQDAVRGALRSSGEDAYRSRGRTDELTADG
ncbi:RDD family protein [Actinacidiphila acidipaludis]|uniref:RDD family protein n=1 Tax=Actinacidiphila acidipaludis TaxID=2873382 RepID=A0ABS7Q458_9ACTN|nr:RDD family protein [Streptomyces acidipaludis]MBY8877927.1 RDD family protein [Streptomyces acidipaludis]